MIKYITVLITSLLAQTDLSAQLTRTYSFEGFFNGENMKIQCHASRTTPWDVCDCIDSILVNGRKYADLLYGGYEIDLANKTDLKTYDTVKIEVFTKGCEMRFLSAASFYPKIILPVEYLMISEDGKVSWAVQQNHPDLKLWVHIEQYKWGEWVRIGPVYTITDEKIYQTDISDYLISGENKFRAVVASIEHVYVAGKPVVINHKGKKIKYKYKKKEKKIYFNRKTHFELWNEEWLIAAKGQDTVIDLKHQKPGIYHLRYGGKEKEIKIK